MTRPEPRDLLGEIYAQWAVEMAAQPEMSTRLLRILFDDWQRATAEPESVTYQHTEIGGVPGIRVRPHDANTSRVLVVLHGGGFALGSSASHRKLAGHLAKACGVEAFVADFRLAPEHPYPAAVEDGLSVVDGLLASGHDIGDITLVGDSAGGNLAIAVALRLMAAGRALPRQVLTMSPWLDMENSGATIDINDATDFLITREGLQANIDRYLSGGASPVDPFVNPLLADLTGFPRLYICAGDVESLFDDSVRLHRLAQKCGVDVTFSVGEGQQHVYPFLAGRHERADAEIAAMAAWYAAGYHS
ncbi:esterase [Prauserella marina]|uniref:Acetyl esterase/lipase n=1 Tax=Prauserella marina TaxID=530584 RepID=A0A222VMV4_9PSEU|nr:alpha/beta hydrolase [Prauserella marina]ASR35245.1 esterase [Prauserella marina]PWV84979.1 acetyl esterase/lipase [Prauserella marina]SDC07763.1 Acetyl esterase/lipase [Prauserella marina]